MAFNKKVAHGSLGKSKKPAGSGPGYIGSLTFDSDIRAGEKLWLAAWVKTGDDNRSYFSIVAEQPQQQQNEATRRQDDRAPPRGRQSEMDDEIPFAAEFR